MNNSKFAVQLLTKIGAPLMEAVNEATAGDKSSKEQAQEQAAQVMAQLLGQTVQMGTLLYSAIGIEEEAEQADTTRVAVTSLCAPLIAKFYTQNKRPPTEDDTKRMVQSLEGILSFGENFSPASVAQTRLQTLDHDDVLFDKNQPSLVMLQAMVPVMNAIEEFPFGQAPRKLVQEIAGKLEARAQEIAKAQQGDVDKLNELMIFKSLAGLYAQCHLDEIKRVAENSAESRENLSIDPVWEHFETKITMVEALMGVGHDAGDVTPAPEVQADAQQQPAEASPQESPSVASNTGAAAGGAGPMGFFKKPKEGETATAGTPETASQPSPDPTPKEAAVTDPSPAPAKSESAVASVAGGGSANPMGFFKPGTKKAEGEDGNA